jgi:hypothetical protein
VLVELVVLTWTGGRGLDGGEAWRCPLTWTWTWTVGLGPLFPKVLRDPGIPNVLPGPPVPGLRLVTIPITITTIRTNTNIAIRVLLQPLVKVSITCMTQEVR